MMGSSSLVPVYSLAHLQAKQRTILKLTKSLLFFLLLCQFNPIKAQAPPKLFPFGLESIDSNLPRDVDDVASPELKLQTPIVFYSESYSGIYVGYQQHIVSLTNLHTHLKIIVKLIETIMIFPDQSKWDSVIFDRHPCICEYAVSSGLS